MKGKNVVKDLFQSLKIYGQVKRNKRIRVKLESIKSITVAGLGKGVGTTYFSTMIGIFLSVIMHKRTAIIVMDNEGISAMKSSVGSHKLNVNSKGYSDVVMRHSFSVKSVDYYYGLKPTVIADIEPKYDIVIRAVTLGSAAVLDRDTLKRLLNSDLTYVIGSMLPWKSRECEKMMSSLLRQRMIKDFRMLTLTWNKDIYKLYKDNKDLELKEIRRIPFEEDPLSIGFDTVLWFRDLLLNSFY